MNAGLRQARRGRDARDDAGFTAFTDASDTMRSAETL
jgi:hypothetical protein